MQLEDIALVTREDLQRVIGLLKATFTHLVLDLSKGYTAIDLVALEMANHILLVTQLDLPCLRNVVRLMMSFGNMNGMADKVKIVVNRVGLESGQITLKKAEETIGREIFWQLPNDYRTMIEARNNGVPLIEQAPKAAVTQSIIALAKTLSGDVPRNPRPRSRGADCSSFGRARAASEPVKCGLPGQPRPTPPLALCQRGDDWPLRSARACPCVRHPTTMPPARPVVAHAGETRSPRNRAEPNNPPGKPVGFPQRTDKAGSSSERESTGQAGGIRTVVRSLIAQPAQRAVQPIIGVARRPAPRPRLQHAIIGDRAGQPAGRCGWVTLPACARLGQCYADDFC